MHIIAGLGNPGRKYENTKHNVGFVTIDYLAGKHGIKVNKIKCKALVGDGMISGQKVLLVKPQTFMNSSGESLRELLAYYKLEPAMLTVIYDDIDIPLGMIRIRPAGGAGTHNGMRSILYQIQSEDFPRIRIGIGKQREHIELVDYVLGGFAKQEIPTMEAAIARAAEAVESILADGLAAAMNIYNRREQSD